MFKVLQAVKVRLVSLEETESTLVWVHRCVRHPQSFYPVTQGGVYRGVLYGVDLLRSWLSAFPEKELVSAEGFCYLDRPKLENFLLSLRKLVRRDLLTVRSNEELNKAAARVAARGLSETVALDSAGKVDGKFDLSIALSLMLKEEFAVFEFDELAAVKEESPSAATRKSFFKSRWAGSERRVFPRVATDLPARLEVQEKPVEAEVRIRDLSAGGARLRTQAAMREGALCFIYFSPDGVRELMCLSKVLSNREIPGESLPVESRVMFMTMESADRRLIERVVQEGLTDRPQV